MQIFLVSESPLETACVLDTKRLNKQILECDWMLDGWKTLNQSTHHPIAKMYKDNLDFVEYYRDCLKSYRDTKLDDAGWFSDLAESVLPEFLKDQQWYFNNFKSRLYTKDPQFYNFYAKFGKSEENYYFVDGEWKTYRNGKQV